MIKTPYLWAKYQNNEWEHIDTADEHNSKEFLLQEYRLAFGVEWTFQWRRRC